MPKVPTYDSPQVEARALPGTQQSSVASPELFGAEAARQIKTGNAVLEAGNDIAAIALKMAEKENLAKTQEGVTEYAKRLQDYQIDMRQNRTGARAEKLLDDFGTWHVQQVEEISKTLTSEAQREAFKLQAQRTGLAGRHDVATFQVGETTKYQGLQAEKAAAGLISLGATAASDDAAQTLKLQMLSSTKAYLNNNRGIAPGSDAEIALLEEKTTEFHAQRIQQLASTNPLLAKSYFEKYKNEIAGSKQAEIGKFADQASAEAQGVESAGAIWQRLGPQGDKDPVNLDKMEAEAREMFKDNPFALKATVASLKERTSAFDYGRSQRSNKLAAELNLGIAQKNMSPTQLSRDPRYLDLVNSAPDMAARVMEHADNKLNAMINRGNALETRKQQELARKGMGAYLQYSNVETLQSMTENQITNLLPVLGNDLTNHLMEKKRALGKSEQKVIEARIDQDDFNHVADKAGLKPFDKSKSDEDKARLGELKFAIETKIDAMQRDKKGPLSRPEKMKLMQEEMDNKVLVDEWGRDPTRPIGTLTSKEIEKAYVVVDGQEVKLSAIPAAERATIITKRQQRGLPVTEQDIAKAWLAKQRAPKSSLVERIP